MKASRATIVVVLLVGTASAAESPAFTKKPTAAQSGNQLKIDFTVDRPTDVAVTVEDVQGQIIRHLAAGVLGKNPPEPLQPNSLTQSLAWDGKDDFGKVALGKGGGPFKVRVQLGMRPEFGGFLMHNPDGSGEISAVAVGPGGTLYVFHKDGTANGNMGGHKIKVYNRDGKHQKVLTPFPADIAPDKVKALGVFQTAEGDLVPHLHNYETLSFYPDNVGVRGRDMPEYSCPAVDSRGRVYWLVKGPALVAVDADGGIPYDTFLGPRLLPDVKDLRLAGETSQYWSDRPCLAVSSDGQYVYFAGLFTGKGDYKTANPLPCVFRVDVAKRGPAEVFVGKRDQAGKEKDLLTAPRGLVVAGGLLYVADPEADRVAIFKEADRSYAGEIAVKNPQVIGVDPANGALYVCAYTGSQTADLIKFSGLGEGKELYRMTLPRTGQSPNVGVHRIAVDASAKPVRIWMPFIYGQPVRLHCIEDAGDKFVTKGDPRRQDLWAEGPRDLSMDRVRGELYVKANGNKTYRLDDRTGEVKETLDLTRVSPGTVLAAQVVPGQDGNLYAFTWNKGLWRLDREGKPLHWDGLDTHIIPIEGMMCFQLRHLALRPFAPPDELYVIATADYLTKNPKDAGKFLTLNVLGQDGKTKRTVIWQCLNGAIPRLDAQGNVYVADLVKPPDRSYPEFFDGKLPSPPKECGGGDLFWNSYTYGSIIKFPPSGGIIWHQHELPKSAVGEPPAELLAKPREPFKRHFAYSPHLTGELQGALWTRFGYAPYSAHMTGNTSHCMCEGSGFDVDSFGRVFFPNLGQYRIEVIDTNNNPITTFGKYGNEDSGGGHGAGGSPEKERPAGSSTGGQPLLSRVKKPDVPLAWPTYVAVSDRWAYVADTVNRRVVRVKLRYAVEETCALP
jgi:outer membrane protein assembly factor BamB